MIGLVFLWNFNSEEILITFRNIFGHKHKYDFISQ